jgi:hypothetical protein
MDNALATGVGQSVTPPEAGVTQSGGGVVAVTNARATSLAHTDVRLCVPSFAFLLSIVSKGPPTVVLGEHDCGASAHFCAAAMTVASAPF